MKYKYYEVEFEDTYSMVIKAKRRPTYKEAEEFLKEDMKNMGVKEVVSVTEISEDEARLFFDFSNEKNWPVFR